MLYVVFSSFLSSSDIRISFNILVDVQLKSERFCYESQVVQNLKNKVRPPQICYQGERIQSSTTKPSQVQQNVIQDAYFEELGLNKQ